MTFPMTITIDGQEIFIPAKPRETSSSWKRDMSWEDQEWIDFNVDEALGVKHDYDDIPF